MREAKFALWKVLLTGALAGFVNGFFGAGGGMFVVPLLIVLVGLADKQAFSSAISIILPLTIVSLVIYAKTVRWISKLRSRICSAARAVACWRGSGSGRFRRGFCTLRWGF